MKRIAIISVYLFLIASSGFGKQKITRVIQELDYKVYGKALFLQITNDIYSLTISGKIKGYSDSTLKSEYSLDDLKKRGDNSETVQFQDGANKGKDTTIYESFDYENVPMWLEVKRDKISFNPNTNVPVALCYKGRTKKQILFYINYQDVKRLNIEEQEFLNEYLHIVPYELLYSGWQILNPENIQKYVLKQFSMAISILKWVPQPSINLYLSDSMNSTFNSETLKMKKNYFSDFGQNLDTESTMGIILIEEFNRNTDTTAILESTLIGLCANIKLKGGMQLYNVPLYYMKYNDAMSLSMLNNGSAGQSIDFFRHVSDYQLLNRASDNPLNSN